MEESKARQLQEKESSEMHHASSFGQHSPEMPCTVAIPLECLSGLFNIRSITVAVPLECLSGLFHIRSNSFGLGTFRWKVNWGNGFVTDQEIIKRANISDATSFFQSIVAKPWISQVFHKSNSVNEEAPFLVSSPISLEPSRCLRIRTVGTVVT